jgi:hypothetical protein
MMVGGIFLASAGAAVLLVAVPVCADGCESAVEIGVLVSGIVLVAAGVPLTLVGAQRVPAEKPTPKVSLGPWVNPAGAGANLRLEL